ncbi:hypothetical protein HK104_010469 [Borealophlyctis nickersoniae]|nr:hypothetical protein HK104_010469 [Borealophlyctis nickersoniae]
MSNGDNQVPFGQGQQPPQLPFLSLGFDPTPQELAVPAASEHAEQANKVDPPDFAIEDLDELFGSLGGWVFNNLGGKADDSNRGEVVTVEVESDQQQRTPPGGRVRGLKLSAAARKRKVRDQLACGGITNRIGQVIALEAASTPESPASPAPSGSGEEPAVIGASPVVTAAATPPKESKRRKVCQACTACRKAHMSCEEARPCGRCTKRGLAHLCHDAPKKGEPQPRSTSTSLVSIRPAPPRPAEFRLAPSPLVAGSQLLNLSKGSKLNLAPKPDATSTDSSLARKASSKTEGGSALLGTSGVSPVGITGPSMGVGSVAAGSIPPPASLSSIQSVAGFGFGPSQAIISALAGRSLPAGLFSLSPQSSTVPQPRSQPAPSHLGSPVQNPSAESPTMLHTSPSPLQKHQPISHQFQQPHSRQVYQQPPASSTFTPHSFTPMPSIPPSCTPPTPNLAGPGFLNPAISAGLAEQVNSLQQLRCTPAFPTIPHSFLSTNQQLFASESVGLEYAALGELWSAAIGQAEGACGSASSRCNSCPYSKLDQFFLTAAGENAASGRNLEERLHEVINAKWQAGLLKPHNYGQGYARLSKYLSSQVTSVGRQRILSVIGVFQTGFAQLARSLTERDLAAVEEHFEKLCLEYDWVFSVQGIPAALWRRTGEVYRANQAFANLTGLPLELFRDGQISIYEIMTEESAVAYWERYGQIAFDQDQKASMALCYLRDPGLPDKEPTQCTCSITLRRDGVGIPLAIIGNFLPAQPPPVRPPFEIPEWAKAGMAAAAAVGSGGHDKRGNPGPSMVAAVRSSSTASASPLNRPAMPRLPPVGSGSGNHGRAMVDSGIEGGRTPSAGPAAPALLDYQRLSIEQVMEDFWDTTTRGSVGAASGSGSGSELRAAS